LRVCCGRAFAQLEEWQKAAESFEHATTMKAEDARVWYYLALLELQRGDRAAYRKVCSTLLRTLHSALGTCAAPGESATDRSNRAGATAAASRDNPPRRTQLTPRPSTSPQQPAKHLQLRIAVRILGSLPAPQPPTRCLPRRKRQAGADRQRL
jgi:hypothetical protein